MHPTSTFASLRPALDRVLSHGIEISTLAKEKICEKDSRTEVRFIKKLEK